MHPIAHHLAEHLPTAWLGEPCMWHESVGSTNAAAMDWAVSGAPAGALVGADDQTRGRGRLGRIWRVAPSLNLTASFVLRPTLPSARMGLVALATGLAIAEALDGLGVDAALKWPNDVLVGGRKVCGILVERRAERGTEAAAPVVVGVGLNVNQRDFPTDLADTATSLAVAMGRSTDAPLSRAAVLVRLLTASERRFDALFAGATGETLRAYTRRMVALGEPVRLLAPDGTPLASGLLCGVDDDGALLLDTAQGRRRFHAGEVSLRPASPHPSA